MSKVCLMCGDTFPDSTTFCPKDGSALRAAVHGDDLIGEVFCERYVVTDLLGEGGMGSVYLARDVRLPQQVAIKVLRDRTAIDPTTVSRFRQEAEAASRINHDRVARVSDFGFMNDGRAYIIMEYVSGRTLKQTLDERGPLPPAEAARITSMVAEGLDAAHRLGIVHRDLKPENVMIVDDAGGGTRVKVLDFGIAKVLQGEETAGRTAPGFVIGTPQWMSPEQILGETLDARSDVFALGLLAYSMLTAQRAYAGVSEQAEMMARLTSLPRPLEEALPGTVWPTGLQALLNRTLARDVNQRPAGALAFARELTKVIDDSAAMKIGATPLQAQTQTQPRSVTRMAVVAGSVLVVGLIAVVVLRETGGSAKTANAAPSAADSTKRTATAPATTPTAGASASAAPAATAKTDSTSKNAAATPTSTATPTATPTAVAKTSTTAGKPPATPATSPPATSTTAASNPPGNAATTGTAKAAAPPATKTPSPPSTGARGTPPATSAPANKTVEAPKNSANDAAAAHDALERIMNDADADIGSNDAGAKRAKAREIIRKLDDLGPKLGSATDQGWAQFYIGTSQATLGDNDKACSSIKRAHSLAEKSAALRSSAEHWQETLGCSR